jgi:hypothetical protein
MVTRELNHKPILDFDPDAIFEEYKARQRRNRGVYRHQISREANAFTILLFGIGFLIFVIGLCTGLMTVPHAFVGWIATWVLAVALRAFCVTSVYRDEVDYESKY